MVSAQPPLDQSISAGIESSLDYGTWHRQLIEQQLSRNQSEQVGGVPLVNTVKVRRIGSSAKAQAVIIEEEETKAVDKTNDYLLNYTFDLSLDDHMRANN